MPKEPFIQAACLDSAGFVQDYQDFALYDVWMLSSFVGDQLKSKDVASIVIRKHPADLVIKDEED